MTLKLKLTEELEKALAEEIYKQNKALFNIDCDEREIKITSVYVDISQKTSVDVIEGE